MLCMLLTSLISAQVKPTLEENKLKKNVFTMSLGLGYADGLIYETQNSVPIFGFSYERLISKRFSLSAHSLIYYRSYPDSYAQGINADYPLLHKFRGSSSPLLSQVEKDKLANSGISQLDPIATVKFLSLPVDLSVTYYPISTKRHRLGINAGFSITYESHNWYQDQANGFLTLPDGTKKQITLGLQTEYRNFSPGLTTKLIYDYSFKDYLIGARISNYNVAASDLFKANESVWETSIYFGFKF